MEYLAGRAIFFYFCRIYCFSHYNEIFEEIFSVALVISILFFFKIGFPGCKAWLGTIITYYITQLSCFIKMFHQICHCQTTLAQMSLFLMTDFSCIFFSFDISSKGKINANSLNSLEDFVVWQVRHVHVSPSFFHHNRRNMEMYYLSYHKIYQTI